ncbi:MAG: ABC transporter permease [Chloroflexi bacterium]|nr:ABC transporter permease [Chloroflexota bacterium]MQC48379.1 ABC transporter permease [Chloroflexota bacterium]
MRPLLGASIKMVVRDRQSVFWALAFPIIFLGIFRLFSFDSISAAELLVAADAPDTPAQQALLQGLEGAEFLDVTVTEASLDLAGAQVAINDSDTDAVLLVSAEGDQALARLVHGINDPIGAAQIEAGIASILDNVNLALQGGSPAIVFESSRVDAEGFSYFEFLGPGIIGMGLMNFATISLAGSLSRYREEGVLRRIRATPLAPWKFFSSVVVAHLCVAATQVVVISLVAEALGANVLRGGLPFMVIAVAGTLIFLNIGVIIAGRVRGRGAVEGAANAITLPMMFLSGAFFPVSQLPEVVGWAVQALPLTHLLAAMRAFVDGDSVASQWPELLILSGWILGTLLVARFSFSLEND